MAFEPSEYSAISASDTSKLISEGLQIGGGLASQAIAGGRRPHRRRHPAPSRVPSHSPLWPVALGLGLVALAGGGYYLYKR